VGGPAGGGGCVGRNRPLLGGAVFIM